MDNLALESLLNKTLNVGAFNDYCPNGLQVEGKSDVKRIMTGVTACQALIDRAVEAQVDALLVHHGFFWKGEPASIRGVKYRRIKALMDSGINLYGYHLPLDAHPVFGNNAQLGQRLGLTDISTLEPDNPTALIACGQLPEPTKSTDFAANIDQVLGRKPLHIDGVAYGSGEQRTLSRIAWCTGGGQDFIETAASAGFDAFISGEISERTVHSARELGIDYFAAGHHATERYGVLSLGEWLAKEHGFAVEFVDIDNPV
uniref:Nif3-like dinuclear metal center hexameric protein n=1 Tax=Thaumasiovibrio occultus TaxID=1891184 RepID=UPI000B34FB73|nr:Nif3-like dinuclear metal center hexameric protein [Thaumasiovibrio occultus]